MAQTNNKTVLMSGADYFDCQDAINAHMDHAQRVNIEQAKKEHAAIADALQSIGVEVVCTEPPFNCQDGVYTANWALCRGNKAVLANLPNTRQAEMPAATQALQSLGKEIITLPQVVRFSGQGDALPCGNLLFMGTSYRTDAAAHQLVSDLLGYKVVSLQTKPKRSLWGFGKPVINQVTGWPDSYFYDIDLALAVIRDDLIAYCPDAFVPESQKKLQQLPINKIVVSYQEATQGFACNLVSTGEAVVMSNHAPRLAADLKTAGLHIITPTITELGKGGGYIRCTTLTLDN